MTAAERIAARQTVNEAMFSKMWGNRDATPAEMVAFYNRVEPILKAEMDDAERSRSWSTVDICRSLLNAIKCYRPRFEKLAAAA